MIPDFSSMGLAANLGVFAVAACIVWAGGDRIARYADAISGRTGLGEAMMGLILLAGVTSLPEMAVSITAARSGASDLAVNNILGSIAMQVALLALADMLIRERALTASAPDSVVLLQGALNILMLLLVAAGALVGGPVLFGVGPWLWGALALFFYSMWQLSAHEHRDRPWIANLGEQEKSEAKAREQRAEERRQTAADQSWPVLIAKTAAAAGAILIGGYVVAQTGEAIADQTGLGQSFVGAVLVAVATSLPEVSTVVSAVRLGLYTMAISDILGTNLLNGALLFGVDLLGGPGSALPDAGMFAAFGALLGATLTVLFVIGIAERRDRTIGRLGVDSVAVLAAYLGGLAILYTLR